MKVDVVEAFEPQAPEPATSSGSAGGQGDFPEVLAGKLEGGRSGGGRGADRESKQIEGAKRSAGGRSAAEAKKANDANRADEADEAEQDAEAAAESGAVSTSAAAQDARRVKEGDEAERGAEAGRLSVAEGQLEEEAADAILGEEGLDEGQARAASEALEAAEMAVGIEDEAGLVAAEGSDAEARGERRAAELAASEAGDASSRQAGLQAQGEVDAAEADGLPTLPAGETDGGGSDREAASDRNESREAELARAEFATVEATDAAVEAQEADEIRAPDAAPVEGADAFASPVAGQVTETTVDPVTGARQVTVAPDVVAGQAAGPATPSAPGSSQPAAAPDTIAVQTEWLASNGGGTARLVLHPPELGEIAIRVTLRGGAVDVVMVAQEAVAQGVAEEQSERLAHAFANRDLRLENFEVRRGSAEDALMGGGGRFGDAEARDEQEAGARGGRGRASGETGGANESSLGPRIVTVTPETGVDLRV